MKKLLLVTLMAVIGLILAADTFAGGYKKYWSGKYASGYAKGMGCPPPPCCEREETITVRVPPQQVCGWVCPDGTDTIPAAEARLAE